MSQESNNQVRVLWKHWNPAIEWFVIGGPSNDAEAQAVKVRFPHVRCFGAEPNPDALAWQRSGKGLAYTEEPFPGTLVDLALWNEDGLELEMTRPTPSLSARASLCRPSDATDMGVRQEQMETVMVRTATLDRLSELHGPFRNVCLWLDIEYAELRALRGATKLLDETLLVNVEAFVQRDFVAINRLLTDHGLVLAAVWNIGTFIDRDAMDWVYVRR